MKTVVLLSGGMDSCVTLFHVLNAYRCARPGAKVDALFYHYDQRAVKSELESARLVWNTARDYYGASVGSLDSVVIPRHLFVSKSSILGDADVDVYDSAEDAVAGTGSDKSYIPLRNGIFVMLAAHRVAAHSGNEEHGLVVTGVRGRSSDAAVPGFPDCTAFFMDKLSEAISEGSGGQVRVSDPLNHEANTRAKTIQMATTLEGCVEALAHTVSCFHGSPSCGKCLPCQRRAQAFKEVGLADPASI